MSKIFAQTLFVRLYIKVMPFTLLAWQHLPIYKKQAIHKYMSRFFLLHFLKVLDKLNIIIDYPVKEIKCRCAVPALMQPGLTI